MMPWLVLFPLAAKDAVRVPHEGGLLPIYKRIQNGKADDSLALQEQQGKICPPAKPPFLRLPFQCLSREALLWADHNRAEAQIPENLRSYLNDICEVPLPTPSELETLASDACKGDEEKKRELICSCLRYAVGFYIRSHNAVSLIRHSEWLDPIQLGNDALIDAVETYQPGHGIAFETYMSARIYYAAVDLSACASCPYFVFHDALWLREYRLTFRALSIQMERDPSVLETLHTMIRWMDEEGFDPYGLTRLDAVRCFLYDRERPENHSGAR